MSEILTLAEKFKQKSDETAETIEVELNNVISKLNNSMTARLNESESIISKGTASLSKQNEQLQQALAQHEQAMYSVLTTYTEQIQAHTYQALRENEQQTKALIENHKEVVLNSIDQHQSEIGEVIKSDMTKWLMILASAGFALMMIGLILGVFISKKVIKPTVIYYEQPKVTTYR